MPFPHKRKGTAQSCWLSRIRFHHVFVALGSDASFDDGTMPWRFRYERWYAMGWCPKVSPVPRKSALSRSSRLMGSSGEDKLELLLSSVFSRAWNSRPEGRFALSTCH